MPIRYLLIWLAFELEHLKTFKPQLFAVLILNSHLSASIFSFPAWTVRWRLSRCPFSHSREEPRQRWHCGISLANDKMKHHDSIYVVITPCSGMPARYSSNMWNWNGNGNGNGMNAEKLKTKKFSWKSWKLKRIERWAKVNGNKKKLKLSSHLYLLIEWSGECFADSLIPSCNFRETLLAGRLSSEICGKE